jgi:hypothetical protein
MSQWLEAARGEFVKRPAAIRVAQLLTDGQNDAGDEAPLLAELQRCAGLFQAHCRGVGDDWSPAQLRVVADTLLGTLGNIAEPSRLAEDFLQTLEAALSKSVSSLSLRLWAPKSAQLRQFKQVFPTEIDMSSTLVPAESRTFEIPLGAWGEGQQDYLVTFDVAPNPPSDAGTLLCRPSLAYDDPATGHAAIVEAEKILVWWSDDAQMTSRISPEVAHYTGQTEKAKAIQEGIEALQRHDVATATLRLGRAAQLAEESGDHGTMRLLRQVVEVEDAAEGTVRIKRDAGKAAIMDLDVASTRTVRANRGRPT